ncbi:hypothetical protein IJI72_01900 [Candidatus Saccharibacteria bacterium]|nr:hypothetical protein [Candidatus Saccharibacteria bacterium]
MKKRWIGAILAVSLMLGLNFVGVGLEVGGQGLMVKEAAATSIASDDLCGSDINEELRKAAGCEETGTVTSPIKNVVKVLLYLVGVISVVMMIYAGLQMTISTGNSGKVAKAKMIMIYALAGLALAILAYVIVVFVVDKF